MSATNPLDIDPLATAIEAEIPNEVTVWRFSFSETIAATARQHIADEIEAERLDTGDGIGFDAYVNGLMRAEEIAREGR